LIGGGGEYIFTKYKTKGFNCQIEVWQTDPLQSLFFIRGLQYYKNIVGCFCWYMSSSRYWANIRYHITVITCAQHPIRTISFFCKSKNGFTLFLDCKMLYQCSIWFDKETAIIPWRCSFPKISASILKPFILQWHQQAWCINSNVLNALVELLGFCLKKSNTSPASDWLFTFRIVHRIIVTSCFGMTLY